MASNKTQTIAWFSKKIKEHNFLKIATPIDIDGEMVKTICYDDGELGARADNWFFPLSELTMTELRLIKYAIAE